MKPSTSAGLLIALVVGLAIFRPDLSTVVQYGGCQGAQCEPYQFAPILAALPAVGGAFTIKEFCSLHRISVAFFYVLRHRGEGPAEMHVGSRVLISHEAATDWRREREAAAAAGIKRKENAA